MTLKKPVVTKKPVARKTITIRVSEPSLNYLRKVAKSGKTTIVEVVDQAVKAHKVSLKK
jgi:hypothetical protein